MTIGVQSRFRSEGQRGVGFQEGRSEDLVLLRNRLSLGFRPTSWLQLFAEGQDARVGGTDNPSSGVKDTFDLRQAWVGIGDEAQWWDLRVGRQKLAYGSERVIGAGEWGNTARVFDAARLSLHHKSNRVDVFSASVVNNDVDHWDHHRQGNNLHGIYGSLGSILPQAKLEPYLLYRTNHDAHSNSWTGGLRTAGAVGPNWSYELEAIRQAGSLANADLRSWAALALVQRHFLQLRWTPSVIGEYNYASGDRRPGDTVVNTYDQIYPTNHSIYGITDQIGRRNTKNFRSGVWLHPAKKTVLKVEASSYWLASRYDALYAASGGVSVAAVSGGASSTHIGNELDFSVQVDPSRYYSVGGQYEHMFAGSFLDRYSPGSGRDFYAFYLDFRM